MRKRLLYCGAFATVLAAGMTSCQSDEPVNVNQDGRVIFSATLADAPRTRAIADGASAKNLACIVYDDKGVLVTRENVTVADNQQANVELKLLKDRTYDIVFFAYPDNGVYDVNENTGKVTIDYAKMNAVVETTTDAGTVKKVADGDCFYLFVDDYIGGSSSEENVMLTRPVAQVNFGTDDLTGVAIIDKTYPDGVFTQVTLDAFTTLDLKTGEAEGETKAVNFPLTEAAAFAGETFPVKEDTYKYVGMAYVLVPVDGSVSDLQIGAFNGNASPSVSAVKVPNAPLKRNFRTNIFGSLLTKSSNWNININDQWDGSSNITGVPSDETIAKGGYVAVTGKTEAITIPANLEQPLTLSISGEVGKLNIGASDKPVTIIVAKDVKYPSFSFTAGAEIDGLTIIGDPTSSEGTPDFGFFYDNTLAKPAKMKNVTFQGVHFKDYGFNNQYSFGVENLVVDGCVFENLKHPAVGTQLTGGNTNNEHNVNVTVKNCTMTFADDVDASANGLYLNDMEGEVVVTGNKINNRPGYCGIQIVQRAGSTANVTVTDNKVADSRKDAIKVDAVSGNIVVTGNNVHSLENCIRIKNSANGNNITVNGNTVDMQNCIDFNGTEPCGILIVNAAENADAALVTVKENTLLNSNGHGFSLVRVNTAEGSDTENPFKN